MLLNKFSYDLQPVPHCNALSYEFGDQADEAQWAETGGQYEIEPYESWKWLYEMFSGVFWPKKSIKATSRSFGCF
jgi:hypothetical protein